MSAIIYLPEVIKFPWYHHISISDLTQTILKAVREYSLLNTFILHFKSEGDTLPTPHNLK